MAVHSPSGQAYLVEQCVQKSSWIFDGIGPMGLLWYKESKLFKAFYFQQEDWSSSFENTTFELEGDAKGYLSVHDQLSFVEAKHEVGTFIVVGSRDSFSSLKDVLQIFIGSLNLLVSERKRNRQTSGLDTKELLLFLLYKTDYFRKIETCFNYFVHYIANGLDAQAVLFRSERKREFFQYAYSTSDLLGKCFSRNYANYNTICELFESPKRIALGEFNQLLIDKPSLFNDGQMGYSYTLVPVKGQNYDLGFLLLQTESALSDCELETLAKVVGVTSRLLEQIQNYTQMINNGKRYKQLFSVTTKFHSSMDQKEILEEVVHSLIRLYPDCVVKLVVSDYGLDPLKKESYAMEAFLRGELQVNHEETGSTSIYAPLTGRQGVYGVLIIKTPQDVSYAEEELSFIQLQATTAGHALENAKLYQQSQRSISDLQLINQASERMNSQLRISETIPYLIHEIMKSFKAEEVGFYSVSVENIWEAYPSSTSFFHSEYNEEFMGRLIHQIKFEGDPIFLGDLSSEVDWKDVSFRSLMAVPMKQDGEIFGVVVALHPNPYQFTFDSFKVMQALVHHSTLALINARLREELERLVITDQLTKLFNRTYLNNKIQESFSKDTSGVLLLIDIDNFKHVNDQYGHLVGDQILIQVAELIRNNIRKEDISARWGGEELAVYLPNLSIEEAKLIATRIVIRVGSETTPRVTISCGLSSWRKDVLEKSNDKLFTQADEALYVAKNTGKNRIECN